MSILDLHLRQRLASAIQRQLGRLAASGMRSSGGASDAASDTLSGEPSRTAFVLLGGGSRGAAQAGALTTLLEAGVVPDIIVAISAGAWNGAYLAADPTPWRAHGLEQAWLATTSHDIVGIDFAELRVSLRIIATDLIAGRPHIFSEGSLLHAVIASSSVPGIFPPVVGERELLVDGGVNEWAGCMTALELGATRICLVACGCQMPETYKPRSFMQVIERSMDVSLRDSFDRTIFALRAAGVDVLPVYPTTPECSFLDFNHAADLIACGREAGLRALALGWNPPRGAWLPDFEPDPEAESVVAAERSA